MSYLSKVAVQRKARLEAWMKVKDAVLFLVKANGRTDEIMRAKDQIEADYKNIQEGVI